MKKKYDKNVETYTDIPIDQSEYYKTMTNYNTSQQWQIKGDGMYLPMSRTCSKLPPGYYEPSSDHSNGLFFQKINISHDELYELPNDDIRSILKDLQTFWENEQLFKELGFLHKRGIILHGQPGCGKSGIIQLVCKKVIEEFSGLVINIKGEDSLMFYSELIETFRIIETTRPIIVVMEDIDELAGESRYSLSLLLNLLDGIKQINNVVYLATTNYLEKLEDRVSNRPSRFDRKYEVKLPNADIRRAFFKTKIKDEALLESYVKDSDGLSLAHCKEMIISTILLGNSYESTMEQLGVLISKNRVITGFSNK